MNQRALWRFATLTALVFLLGIPATSRAGTLLGITFSNQLIRIDPTTGAGTLIGDLDSNMLGFGIAVRNGLVYTYDQNAERIQQIDPATGHTVATIDIGTGNLAGEGDLAFRSDGIGFMSGVGSPFGTELLRFDLTVPNSSGVSSEPFLFDGLAFSSGNMLYGMSQGNSGNNGSTLYTVDQTTGATTLIGSLNILPAAITEQLGGLTFGSDGTLWAELSNDRTTSTLARVDIATGQATVVGNIAGFGDVSGIAFLEEPTGAVPEPSTIIVWSLIGGFFGIGAMRNRLKRTVAA